MTTIEPSLHHAREPRTPKTTPSTLTRDDPPVLLVAHAGDQPLARDHAGVQARESNVAVDGLPRFRVGGVEAVRDVERVARTTPSRSSARDDRAPIPERPPVTSALRNEDNLAHAATFLDEPVRVRDVVQRVRRADERLHRAGLPERDDLARSRRRPRRAGTASAARGRSRRSRGCGRRAGRGRAAPTSLPRSRARRPRRAGSAWRASARTPRRRPGRARRRPSRAPRTPRRRAPHRRRARGRAPASPPTRRSRRRARRGASRPGSPPSRRRPRRRARAPSRRRPTRTCCVSGIHAVRNVRRNDAPSSKRAVR